MYFPKALLLFLFLLSNVYSRAQTPIWIDTDLMIGLPSPQPREVDDAIALIMALKQPQKVTIKGVSIITNVAYGFKTAQKIINAYSPDQNIPVYMGSDSAHDLGQETPASLALYEALKKEKLTILAIGPLTNIATLLKNHPDIIPNIKEVVVCAGRTASYPFKLGIGNLVVWDYNFETDPESFKLALETGVHFVFSGFECSESLLLSHTDFKYMSAGSDIEKWTYSHLLPWAKTYKMVFGVEGFVPWDTTPLGNITHPQYFLYEKQIPVQINTRLNDATVGPNLRQNKPFLEVSRSFSSKTKVDFAYKTKPGFEDNILEILKK